MVGRGRPGALARAHCGVCCRRRRSKPKAIESIKSPTMKRLTRRAGVKRAQKYLYFQARKSCFKYHVKDLVREAAIYADYARRKSVTLVDVLTMMKRRGTGMYGFGWFLEPTAYA